MHSIAYKQECYLLFELLLTIFDGLLRHMGTVTYYIADPIHLHYCTSAAGGPSAVSKHES